MIFNSCNMVVGDSPESTKDFRTECTICIFSDKSPCSIFQFGDSSESVGNCRHASPVYLYETCEIMDNVRTTRCC